jgi:hypothetical protein
MVVITDHVLRCENDGRRVVRRIGGIEFFCAAIIYKCNGSDTLLHNTSLSR